MRDLLTKIDKILTENTIVDNVQENTSNMAKLQDDLDTYQFGLKQAKTITKAISYLDSHSKIISEIVDLAEKVGLDQSEFEYQISDINEKVSELASLIYGLEDPFKDAILKTEDAIAELEYQNYSDQDE
jgi:hypothetical protein